MAMAAVRVRSIWYEYTACVWDAELKLTKAQTRLRSRRRTWAVLSPPSLWPRRPHRRPAPAQTPEQSANVQQSAIVFVNLYLLTWQDGVDCWQAVHGRGGWDCTLQICVLSLPDLVPTRFETVQVTDLKSVGGFWG